MAGGAIPVPDDAVRRAIAAHWAVHDRVNPLIREDVPTTLREDPVLDQVIADALGDTAADGDHDALRAAVVDGAEGVQPAMDLEDAMHIPHQEAGVDGRDDR